MQFGHVHSSPVPSSGSSIPFRIELRETLNRPGFEKIGWGLVVAAAYYAGTKLGFALTPEGHRMATLWPPNAMLLAALLLAPYRLWWVLLLAVLPVHLLVQVRTGVPMVTACGWFVGNIGEALIGAVCVRRFARASNIFDNIRGVVVFMVFGAIAAPLVTSFLDAANVVSTGWGQGYWMLWTSRLFSNVLAELVFVPTIVIWCSKAPVWMRSSTPARRLEGAVLAVGILAVSTLVFGTLHASPNVVPALVYLPLPLLLWASLRFGLGGLSPSLLVIAFISIWNAMAGRGPFTSPSLENNVLSLQVLLCTVAIPLMLLATVMAERQRTEESLREVSRKLMYAQEQERERIASELHDDIGQQLVLVELGLNQFPVEANTPLAAHVTDLRNQIAEISHSARELSHGLHPSQLDHLGLGAAVRRLCQDVAHNTVLVVQCNVENTIGSLPRDLSLCLYRIVQESLQNVVKHSGASEVIVSLKQSGGLILLQVTDNGTGFAGEERQFAGLGLMGMRERLRPLKGEIRITSQPGKGTNVEVKVPARAI